MEVIALFLQEESTEYFVMLLFVTHMGVHTKMQVVCVGGCVGVEYVGCLVMMSRFLSII